MRFLFGLIVLFFVVVLGAKFLIAWATEQAAASQRAQDRRMAGVGE